MPNRSSAPKAAEPSAKNFPVVCIGGSAGGLDTYIRLLQNLRADMGVAFVIVNHMTTLTHPTPRSASSLHNDAC